MAEPYVWIQIGARKYRCFYGLQEYAELERLCAGEGTGIIRARISKGRYGFSEGEVYPELAEYRVPELWEVVRQGVIGGGMMSVDGAETKIDGGIHADDIIKPHYFGITDQRVALTKLWAHAYEIIVKLCDGYMPPKKAERVESPPIPKKGSTGRGRSRTAQ